MGAEGQKGGRAMIGLPPYGASAVQLHLSKKDKENEGQQFC
jgi:hypothetical protein